MKRVTIVYQGRNGDIEAHKPGCRDLQRASLDSPTEDFEYENEDDLSRQISTAIVGDLESAIAETGNPNGGWYVQNWMPCTKHL